ncbi:MAG TPA: serine/threonine protein kinase [Gammaproteobacteria bacterium]|nr:serine/threonine protein kinase [Gammaproteobacteria bacterium]
MATRIELKRGTLGDVYCEIGGDSAQAVRDLGPARWRWLARRLARREARALVCLDGTPGVPRLIAFERDRLIRSFLPGEPLHRGVPPSREYFRRAFRLVCHLHRLRVAHNDLAKEANWIASPGGVPGIVDFQLAICFARRGRLFRLLAREDLRHLLKHKRHYLPDTLTDRERRILARPMWPARWWRTAVKPGYRFVTRRLLGWSERDGAAERERSV